MTDTIYPTADFAADEFHQKYGFNDIKSDTMLTIGAMGEKTLDQGLAMNALSAGVIKYDEAHNKPAADKYINSYNTLMDQYNTVLQHSDHPVAKVVAGIGGFIGQPTVAIGGAGLSSFVGKASSGFMAHLAESRLASIGLRTTLIATEAATVTAPEAISHAYLAQSTPLRDNYNYMDSLREVGQNFLLGGLIHLGIVEPIRGVVEHVGKKYTPPVQLSTTESVREATGKVESDLMNEDNPNARAELHQGFNDQRNSLKDPTVDEVRANAADIRERIAKTDSKIKDLQEEVKEPVEPTRTMSAREVANRIARIEEKPEEIRTDLEKNLLETLPRTETIEKLKNAMTKHETVLTPEEDELLQKLHTTPEKSRINERKLIDQQHEDLQEQIDKLEENAIKARKAGDIVKADTLEREMDKPQEEIDRIVKRANDLPGETTEHNEAALQKIDKLEDQRANLQDALDNHRQALDVLQQPKEAVDPQESATKPMFYEDTDPISDAEKITPEEEISGRPEGIDVKEADFTEKGKQELESIREEKKELGNYKKLMQRIVECITNVFYKG